MRAVITLIILIFNFSTAVQATDTSPNTEPKGRVFEFQYEILAADFPSNEAVDIYIPLPAEHDGQQVLNRDFRSSIPGQEGVDSEFNNRF